MLQKPNIPTGTVPTPEEQQHLDAAEAVRQRLAAAKAERDRVIAGFGAIDARRQHLETQQAAVESHLSRIERGRDEHLAELARLIETPEFFSNVADLGRPAFNVVGLKAAADAVRDHLDKVRARLVATVAEARAYGKANGIPESEWPANVAAVA